MKTSKFEDLFAWQSGHKVVLGIYKISKTFPDDEKFGITSQIRRAAVSITSNIAEGYGRRTSKDKLHFFQIANGSLLEVRNLLRIAVDLNIVEQKDFDILLTELDQTQRLLVGLINKLR